jgi:hypothetical protein
MENRGIIRIIFKIEKRSCQNSDNFFFIDYQSFTTPPKGEDGVLGELTFTKACLTVLAVLVSKDAKMFVKSIP